MRRFFLSALCAVILFTACTSNSGNPDVLDKYNIYTARDITSALSAAEPQTLLIYYNKDEIPISTLPFRYGRSLLVGDNAALYDSIAELLAQATPSDDTIFIGTATGAFNITISWETNLTDDNIMAIANMFLRENPKYYWAELSLIHENNARQLTLTYRFPPEEILRRQIAIDARAAEILTPLKNADDFHTAIGIHDALAVLPYDFSERNPDRNNIYGILVRGSANCDGYASAFQYLAQLAGLESIYLVGESFRGIPHAWNAVRLDGAWHFIDVTWNRPTGRFDEVYRTYFLMDSELMFAERRWDEGQYPVMPYSGEGFRNYFQRMGFSLSGPVPDDAHLVLAEMFFRQLNSRSSFPTVGRPIYLAVRVSDSPEIYDQWKTVFIEQLFPILHAIQQMAQEQDAPFMLDTLTRVSVDYFDVSQVLVFYPIIVRR